MQVLTRPEDPGSTERWDGEPDQAPRSGVAKARALIAAALGPLVTGYAVTAALLALISAVASQAQFSPVGVLLAAGPGWLAANQVPLQITGQPLGVLPLLATVGVVLLAARAANTAAQRLGYREPGEAVVLVGTVAGTHAVFGATISVLSNGSVVSAEPLSSFLVPGLLAGTAATAGVAKHAGILAAARNYLDPVALRGLRAGALGLAGLLAVGAAVSALSLGLSTSTARELFASNAPGFGSSLGMFLLSLGYLPNAVVFGLSFAAGPGFSIGSVVVSPSQFTGGPVPGLPVLAGIPEHHATWWPLLMLLPALVGAGVGWTLRRVHEERFARLRTVAVAGALVGFGCVLLGTVAGGRLADGPFDPVSVPVAMLSLAAFCWIVIPGGLVAWFAGPGAPAEEEIPEAEYIEDEEPEEDTDSVVEEDREEDVEEDTEESEDADETADFEDELLESEIAAIEDEVLAESEEPEAESEDGEEAEAETDQPDDEDHPR